MNNSRDEIPPNVKRSLRQEVGYGCPICRRPFLTWHHFDPPYRIEPHDRPEGMIALCREHHDEADQGLFSMAQLRSLKNTTRSADDVKGNFPSWNQPNMLVRIGGIYFGGSVAVLAVAGEPIITLTQNDQGMLSLSFALRDQAGNLVVAMRENAFEVYPTNVHDLTVAARKKSIKVWLGVKDIGLVLSFDRGPLAAINERLAGDRERADKLAAEALASSIKDLPPGVREMINQVRAQSFNCPSSFSDGLPQNLREAMLSGDLVGHRVRAWVQERGLDVEGKVPFLDFQRMAIYYHGERITIKNGIGGMQYCASFDNACGVNLRCTCKSCLSTVEHREGESKSSSSTASNRPLAV